MSNYSGFGGDNIYLGVPNVGAWVHPECGHAAVFGLEIGGTGKGPDDKLDFDETKIQTIQQLMRHTSTDSAGEAVVHFSAQDTMTMVGVTKAEMFHNARDFVLGGYPMPMK